MKKTKFRVTMSTNSGARALDKARQFRGVAADCKHNGGKLVFMTTDAPDSLKHALDHYSVTAFSIDAEGA